MREPSDLVQGTLDLLILKTISLEPKHGWAIAKRIQRRRDLRMEAVHEPLLQVRCAVQRQTGKDTERYSDHASKNCDTEGAENSFLRA
jgi:hypothetical protein